MPKPSSKKGGRESRTEERQPREVRPRSDDSDEGEEEERGERASRGLSLSASGEPRKKKRKGMTTHEASELIMDCMTKIEKMFKETMEAIKRVEKSTATYEQRITTLEQSVSSLTLAQIQPGAQPTVVRPTTSTGRGIPTPQPRIIGTPTVGRGRGLVLSSTPSTSAAGDDWYDDL